jgi:hypothetical protein
MIARRDVEKKNKKQQPECSIHNIHRVNPLPVVINQHKDSAPYLIQPPFSYQVQTAVTKLTRIFIQMNV